MESLLSGQKAWQEALDILEQKGLLCEEKGGVLVDLTKHKLDKAVVKRMVSPVDADNRATNKADKISPLFQMEQVST